MRTFQILTTSCQKRPVQGAGWGSAPVRSDIPMPEQALTWPDELGPNMLLDDGGDATLLVHKGAEVEAAGLVPEGSDDDPEEWRVILGVLRASLAADPLKWTKVAGQILGVTEETTTGVHRLYEMAKEGTLQFPAINLKDSGTP